MSWFMMQSRGYCAALAQIRETLDRRYEEFKSGSAELLDGDVAMDRLRKKSSDRN
jgi:hypothetical protein